MSGTAAAFLVAALVALGGCGGPQGGEEGTIPPKAAKAAAIAAEIEADPANVGMILEKHGMTEDAFRDLMYEIAEDEELSLAYEKARGG